MTIKTEKRDIYEVHISVSEDYVIYMNGDFIRDIAYDKLSDELGEDEVDEAIEGLDPEDEIFLDAVQEAVNDGWPGDTVLSEWSEECLAENGTRSLGGGEHSEVHAVSFHKDMEMAESGRFPA